MIKQTKNKGIEFSDSKYKVFPLELNKTYDLAYCSGVFDIDYLSSVTVSKITAKMYYLTLPDGTTEKIAKDSLMDVKIKE